MDTNILINDRRSHPYRRRVVNMVNKIIIIMLLLAIIGLLIFPAGASLVPMSWGFPTFNSTRTLSNFEQNFGWSSDFEFSDISFPTASNGNSFSTTFPTITQISNKTMMFGNFAGMSQTESTHFSYPWISIGFSPVPSMGFL